MQAVQEVPEHDAGVNPADTIRAENAEGDGTMTTSSTRLKKHADATKDERLNEEEASCSSNSMTGETTTPTKTKTTCRDLTQGMKKTPQAPQTMPQDQRDNAIQAHAVNASIRSKNAGSKRKISKRNRRRKKQFTDPDQLESEIRQAYFSAASWVAMRYSVSVEDLIDHVRAGGLHHAARSSSASQYVEDIVLSVAICQGSEQAWRDLRQVFDLTLNRACTLSMSEQDAMVFVQKFLSDLADATERAVDSDERSDTAIDEDAGLRDYIGLVPLRVWLTNRILATLDEMPRPETSPATDNGRAGRTSLQLVP